MVSLSNHDVKSINNAPFDKLRVTKTIVYKQALFRTVKTHKKDKKE